MNSNQHQLSSAEASILFDEIYVVKEKDFSIQINFLGSNHPKVLHTVYLPPAYIDDSLGFIYTVSEKGLKINQEETAVVNLYDQQHLNIQNLTDYFMCNYIIFWGCDEWLKKQNIQSQNYSCILLQGINCIVVEPSKVIAGDAKLKGIFWNLLQKVFFEK